MKGAILSIKLRHLEHWTEIRKERAALYSELLADTGLKLPAEPEGARCVYHVYVIQTEKRDELIEALNEQGIGTNIHYPVPIHLQKAFAYLGYKRGDFPVAEQAAERILSLPLCADITEQEVREVCRVVKSFFAGGK